MTRSITTLTLPPRVSMRLEGPRRNSLCDGTRSQRLRPSVPSKFWIRMAGMLVLRVATPLPCDFGITCRVDNTRLLSSTVLVLLCCGWGIDAQQVFCAYLVYVSCVLDIFDNEHLTSQSTQIINMEEAEEIRLPYTPSLSSCSTISSSRKKLARSMKAILGPC